jgi:4'-phosphopantetheinyl transferase
VILHAVVAAFSAQLSGRAALERGRELARLARAESARLADAPLDEFPADEDGAPLAAGGWHWSSTHTRGMAASVVAPARVGIDAEWLGRPRLSVVRRRFPEELARMADQGAEGMLRLWTAKEALLKMHGVGVADLARCPLVEARPDHAVIEYRGAQHRIHQLRHAEHVLALSCEAPDWRVELHELAEDAT